MIHTIIADIAAQVKAQLPWVTETKAIARQDVSGVILMERPEEYPGIDDRKAGRLYFRYRDGWETTYAPGKVTSGPNVFNTDAMRAVFMHFCDNDAEIARFLALAIGNARNTTLRYGVTLRTKSTDKQYIVAQETKGDAIRNDTLRLVMVDFDVTYRDAVLTGEETCIPQCHVC